MIRRNLIIGIFLFSGFLAGGSSALAGEKEWMSFMDAGKVAFDKGDYDGAIKDLSQALKEAEGLKPEENYLLPPLRGLGDCYTAKHSYKQAEEMLNRAVLLVKNAVGSRHISVADDLLPLAIVYGKDGQIELMKKHLNTCISIWRVQYGENHPYYADNLEYAVRVLKLFKQDNDAQALETTIKNIRATADPKVISQEQEERFVSAYQASKARDPLSKDTAKAAFHLGIFYSQQHQYSKSEQYYKEAISIWSKYSGEETGNLTMVSFNLAGVEEELGKFTEAKIFYEQALKNAPDFMMGTIKASYDDLLKKMKAKEK